MAGGGGGGSVVGGTVVGGSVVGGSVVGGSVVGGSVVGASVVGGTVVVGASVVGGTVVTRTFRSADTSSTAASTTPDTQVVTVVGDDTSTVSAPRGRAVATATGAASRTTVRAASSALGRRGLEGPSPSSAVGKGAAAAVGLLGSICCQAMSVRNQTATFLTVGDIGPTTLGRAPDPTRRPQGQVSENTVFVLARVWAATDATSVARTSATRAPTTVTHAGRFCCPR